MPSEVRPGSDTRKGEEDDAVSTAVFWADGTRKGVKDADGDSNTVVARTDYLPDGMKLSTHTDKDGYVIATFDDGDLGIYMHEGLGQTAKNEVDLKHSTANTSAGGHLMGYSLHPKSFSKDFGDIANEENKPVKIDFGSTGLSDIVNKIIDSKPSILEYMKNAQGGGIWDIRKNIENGPILYENTYASPRDAGNFAAGMFAGSQGPFSEMIMYGYGVYNLSGNEMGSSMKYLAKNAVLHFVNPASSLRMYINARYFGEHPLSRLGQELGLKYYKNEKR